MNQTQYDEFITLAQATNIRGQKKASTGLA